jgi:uncharacterized repeat protein (TIGR03803 family)
MAQIPDFIFNFSGASGAEPSSVPIQGRDGNLYGATLKGGAYGLGAVYRMTTSGKESVFHSFANTDGSSPLGLILATDGNFYGSTLYGGAWGFGVLFKLSADGKLTILHQFADDHAGQPGPLIEADDGNFYGTTANINLGAGIIYRLTPSGNLTPIFPIGVGFLLQGSDGDLYDAVDIGVNGCGGILKLSLSGSLLSSDPFSCKFGPNTPTAPFIEGQDGSYYGTAAGGGAHQDGEVFELGKGAPTKVLHPLYEFGTIGGDSDGAAPQGLMQACDGVLYGLTAYGGKYGMGTLFKLTTSGSYTQLYDFNSSNETRDGMPGMVQHTDGSIYGVTQWGGTQQSGTFFQLDIGEGPFIALVRSFGKIGDTVQILGKNLTGSVSVMFNGVPVTDFSVVSDTFMTAVVPRGAITGRVVVSTSSGSLVSNKTFRVVQ